MPQKTRGGGRTTAYGGEYTSTKQKRELANQKRNEQRRRASRAKARTPVAPKATPSVKSIGSRLMKGARFLGKRSPYAFVAGVASEAIMRQFVDPVIARNKKTSGERLRSEAASIDAEFAKLRKARPPKADPRKTPRAEISMDMGTTAPVTAKGVRYKDVRQGRATAMQEMKARRARVKAANKK
jgi:hypothetical protein